jgi:membrane protein DedA with SNARE-associated domain
MAPRMETLPTPTDSAAEVTMAEPADGEPTDAHEQHAPIDIEITKMDVLCVAPIMLASIWALVGSPISPKLITTHPVLLAFLRGSIASMIACGANAHAGTLPLWQAILAPLPILVWVDPFYYWAGTRYGRKAFDHYAKQSERWRKRIARGEAMFARFGFWAILFSAFLPFAVILFLAAGETRMRFWKFAVADVLSNLMWIGLVVSLGWFIKDQALSVADTISHYGTILTIVLIGVVVIVAVRNTRAQMRGQGARLS